MSSILALSIGPVGGFIAAGRRSRDLWYGSSWLSDTTVAVAKTLLDRTRWPAGVTVELLLPSASRLSELAQKHDGMHGGRVSNKVLARVTHDERTSAQQALNALAETARRAAIAHLVSALDKLTRDKRLPGLIDVDAFTRQVEAIERGDFIEFSAAWSPLPPGEDPFGSAVKRACELRDASQKLFLHPGFSRLGVARSDLDEGRDTVLASGTRGDDSFEVRRARLGVIESEELDSIGLLRRVAAGLSSLPFPPLSRVAADPWIEGCYGSKSTKSELTALVDAITQAKLAQGEDFFVWCSPASDTDIADFTFAYDASVLFEGGCDALLASAERLSRGSWSGAPRVLATLRDLRVRVRKLHRLAGSPNPYYALLEVDGDRIGTLLSEQRTRARYDALVGALDEFADGAAQLISADHGTAFYVAGDELSAYVPLDRALPLASALATDFAEALKKRGFADATLSAGVVFAHVKDDLRGVRKAARDALHGAKASGPGHLCVREMPRSGSDREIVGPIATVVANVAALAKSIRDGHVSLRTEQHLREHHERFSGVTATEGVDPGVLLARDAVRRQFERAGRDDSKHPLTPRVDGLRDWNGVLRLADELRIASRIHDVGAQREAR